MSVKSERRAWFAANVEAKPAGEIAGSALYQEWVARANAHMVSRCVPGTAILKDPADVAPVEKVARKARKASVTDKADRETYVAYVDSQRAKIADHMGWAGEYWDDFFKPQTHGADARRRPDLEFCKGSLKVAWPHLTEEMQRAHAEGVFRWVTFAEFKSEQVAERAAMAEAYATAEPENCTLCLEELCECEDIAWAA